MGFVDGDMITYKTLLDILPEETTEKIAKLTDAILVHSNRQGMIFICGNGGSAANANHFAEDLCLNKSRGLKVVSLCSNTPWITAIANDIDYDYIFVEQLKSLASQNDLLITISGSANSPNIIKAIEWGNANGLTTFLMTGFYNGCAGKIAQNTINVPSISMGVIESLHLFIFHYILMGVNETK